MTEDTMIHRFLRTTTVVVFCMLCIASHNSYAQAAYDSINYNRGTFFGKSTNDSYLLHMAVDAQGNIYGTGHCTNIVTTSGVYQPSSAGSSDVMVFKMDPTMKTVLWATYIGGSNIDAGGSIAIGPSGEVYVSGYTASANFPVTVSSDAAYLSTGITNIFALKLSADGSTLLYSRILGRGPTITQQTATASKGAQVAINPAGQAFVFSHTASSVYQITGTALQGSIGGSSDFCLTKLDAGGGLLYSTFYGGSGAEIAYDICYTNGKVYCTGTTASSNLSQRSGKIPDASGDCCVFVADDNGSVAHPRKAFVYGSTGADQGLSVCYDSRVGRICLTGTAGSVMTFTSTLNGQNTGGFLASIDSGLNALTFVTIIGTSSVPTSITVRNQTGTIYSAGYTSSTSLPKSVNAYQSSLRGSMDGFMVAVDSTGSSLRYGSYIGGTSSDYSAAKVLIVERSCVYRVIFGITTHSADFPTTPNTYQPQKLNGPDDQPAIVMFSPQPSAQLQYTSLPCNTLADFALSSTCPLSNIVWKFGDGATQNGSMTASHNYPGFGLFKLEVRGVTSDGDTLIMVREITIGNRQVVDAGPDQIVCRKNPFTQLNATGAVTYRWSPGKEVSDSTISNPTTKPTKTTTYVVYGRDSFGCESWDSVTVVVRDIKISVERDTTICEGRFAQLRVSGADLYNWSPTIGLNTNSGGTVLAAPPTSTAYTVIGFNGVCYDTSYVSVTVIPRPRIRMSAVPGICANTPVQLDFSVSAPLGDSDIVSVQWSPNTNMDNPKARRPVVTPSKDTWYRVTVVSKYGCVTSDSVLVKIQNKLTIAVSNDTTICEGGVAQLHANGAAQYEWSPPEGLDNPSSNSPRSTATKTTRYRVIGRGGLCVDTQYVTVRIEPLPTFQRAMGDTSVCTNDRVHFWMEGGAVDGVTYSWYPAAEFENATGASVYLRPQTKGVHTYTVLLTNASGCTRRDSVQIQVENVLTLSTGPNQRACPGEKVAFRITSAHDAATTFSWTPNDGVWNAQTQEYEVIVSQSKNYHVHVQRGSCFSDADFSLSAKELPNFSLSSDTSLCYGSVLQLEARSSQSGMQYRWLNGNQLDSSLDNAQTATPTTHALTKDMVYTVEADLDGCVATKSMRVHVFSVPQITLRSDTTICAGESIRFQVNGTNLKSIRWSPSSELSSSTDQSVTATPSKSTVYTVDIVNTDGCTASAQFRVGVQPRARLYFRVLPVNEGNVLSPGDSTSISIAAWSDSARVCDLRFDVALHQHIFQPSTNGYTDAQNQRFMHVQLPATQLQSTEQVVYTIRGIALQAAPASSDIIVTNVELDPAMCPIHSESPSIMSIASCFSSGRNISYLQPLQASVSPNPIPGTAVLQIRSSEQGPMQVQLLNVLGQQVRTWDVQHNNSESTHTLDFNNAAAGRYTITIYSANRSVSLPVLKVD